MTMNSRKGGGGGGGGAVHDSMQACGTDEVIIQHWVIIWIYNVYLQMYVLANMVYVTL